MRKKFDSIPDEQSQQVVRDSRENHLRSDLYQIRLKCPLLGEMWNFNFSMRILERVVDGSIINIRNECLIFWVHGEWIGARNKQIVREPLRGSRDLFVPRSDSFPMNPEKETLIP